MVRKDHGIHPHNMFFRQTRWMFPVAALVACLAMPVVSWAQARPAALPEATPDSARFDVLEYEIEGNTVLGELAVERAVLPHMGAQRSLADVENARAALEKAYQAAGYLTVLVDLPEQRVADGVVRLRVTEGRIERLRVIGARYFSQGHIRAMANAFQEGEVPDLNLAQLQLAELNRSAARQVQPVLRPGSQPGTVDVELKVRDALPLSGSVELNNHHAAHTDALRLSASLRYDNLLQRDHVLALTLSTAPRATSQTQVASLSYTVPTTADASWTATFTHSNSNVEPLGNTVLGQGSTAGLRWSVVRNDASSSHRLSLGGELRDLQQRVRSGTGPATGAAAEISTPLRYLPFNLDYAGQWWHGTGAANGATEVGASSRLDASFSFGLRGLLRRQVPCPPDDTLQDQFACNREGADGGFATLRLGGGHERAMPGSLPGRIGLRFTAQLATQALVSGEQINAGGVGSVRGYLQSEASGDLGLLAGLQWDSPNLAGTALRSLDLPDRSLRELVARGFVDTGLVRVIDPQPGQAARTGLAGAGIGLRLAATSAQGEIDLAWPLKATAVSPQRRLRVHARMAIQF